MKEQRQYIEDFLAQARIAFVGLSHNEEDFSRAVFRDLKSRGYDVVPVNPSLTMAEGVRAFPSVRDIEPPVDAAYIMVSAGQSGSVVKECHEAGIGRIWLHKGAGPGAHSEQAVTFCREHGMSVVDGQCIEMFLSDPHWIHRVHRGLKKLVGSYPA